MVSMTRLPSGLRVATDPMSDCETVTIGIYVGAGSRYEAQSVNGVAHFLEHMAFKGTKTRSAYELAKQIESVGGQINAYTGREMTAYYVKLLANDQMFGLDILADMLQNSLFSKEEIENERTVILQELGQCLDTPDDIIFDYFQEAAFPEQPLGRSILGSADTIKSLSRQNLVDYVNTHYRSENIVICASGNVTHTQFVANVAEKFCHIPQGHPHDPITGIYRGGIKFIEKELEQLHLALGFEGLPYDHPDYYTLAVLSIILGGGMSSRLFQEIREKRGLVYTIQSFNSIYADTGLFTIYAGTSPDSPKDLFPALCDQLNDVCVNLNEEEIQRAKAQLRASLVMGRESNIARSEQVAQSYLAFGRHIDQHEMLEKLEKVTKEGLHRVAQHLFSSPITLAALGPLQNMPPEEHILALMPK